jgi:hypothetical protein
VVSKEFLTIFRKFLGGLESVLGDWYFLGVWGAQGVSGK